MKNEENLRNEFINEKWVKQSKNINIDKIISDLPSLQYYYDECKKLENFCTEKFFMLLRVSYNYFI